MRQLAHDSFSRVTTYKQRSRQCIAPFNVGHDEGQDRGCHECGNFDGHGLVYRFTVRPDDCSSTRPANWSAHEFCSVGCWRTYNT